MALAPPPVIDATSPFKHQYLTPQILWPASNGYGDNGKADCSAFPSLTAIKARYSARSHQPLEAFVEAVWDARDRILILDDYLFKPIGDQSQQVRYEQILSWLMDGLVANDIRFLTNNHEDECEIQNQFNARVTSINQRSPRRSGLATINIKFSLGIQFPYVHDRFAIIDNELWHFGATVGGLHGNVNAASRGWDANAHDAVRFFNEAWNGDGDVVRRGGHD